ncbi:MAG: hypothetical protein ACUVV6_07605 [Thermoplasmatota archaeon]
MVAERRGVAIPKRASRRTLRISEEKLRGINAFLLDPKNAQVNALLGVIDKYGGVEEIRRRARESGSYESLMARLERKRPEHARQIEWMVKKRDEGAFITVDEYRRRVLGPRADRMRFDMGRAVTLEISACQYFSHLVAETRQAVKRGELMPGRFIRVRNMREQEADGDLLAVSAAMKVFGASVCETLDTRGTDGANVHLGGPETITGYFGGVGQPNDYPVRWLDELLYYHTSYGVRQVLNVNSGTILAAYMLHRLGVDIEFKISVYMGNDNPFAVLWTILAARLFSRDDGTTPLIGFNFSNSVNNDTIRQCARIRRALGLERNIRFEHHILETWKSIVRQPYDRRAELVELAADVPNISAKHEGGEVAVERKRKHPSDILDYFLSRDEVERRGLGKALLRNYLDKHEGINNTARALTEAGLTFVAAPLLHHRDSGRFSPEAASGAKRS